MTKTVKVIIALNTMMIKNMIQRYDTKLLTQRWDQKKYYQEAVSGVLTK